MAGGVWIETPIREYCLLSLFPECELFLGKHLFGYNFQIYPSSAHAYGLLDEGYGGLRLRVGTKKGGIQVHPMY